MRKILVARKKKIYVDDFLQGIKISQVTALDSLKIYTAKLKKISENMESKIERDGIDGYYSRHHDAMPVIQQIYTTSLRLGELKKLEEELKSFNKKNK